MDLSTGSASVEPLSACMKIPFSSEHHAEVAYNSLRIDPEPKRALCSKKLSLHGNILQVDFVAQGPRHLRSSMRSFSELLLLVIKTIERFHPKPL
ncbi:uncharacterized protein LOC135367172 [Ornithodoros turicata]|uniref:uncharacterized protein LOC135367172 n=1 Tax=Ornithodoros turicata TaxID=34597 RepID=UPI003139154C